MTHVNCFLAALLLMENNTVAIIGPQYSVMAHVISHIANELQVPLLSFAATDPTLTSLQFPYFVRTSQSDQFQMAAVADIVDYYQWRDVIAIYIDDDHGRNGIVSLEDKLAEKRCKISYKAPLRPNNINREEINSALVKVIIRESRVIVLHIYPSFGLEVLKVAESLSMLGSGYVWLATDWLSTALDTDPSRSSSYMNYLQGVITLRVYTPDSGMKKNFTSRWSNLTKEKALDQSPFMWNTYGLYAYDTVWVLAYALDSFFNSGGTLSFTNDSSLNKLMGDRLGLDSVGVFANGSLLMEDIMKVNRTGLTGQMMFSSDGERMNPAYEIINVIGTGIRRIGFWSNSSGLHTGQEAHDHVKSSKGLYGVIWPGQTTVTPRGWVFANDGRHLKIGVPLRISYSEFVSRMEGSEMFGGYCIDVFKAAVDLLPYPVPYKFVPFGDGKSNPLNSELLHKITASVSKNHA